MITSANREEYNLVWARVRSTRVPISIHNERSFKMLRTLDQIRNSVPTGTRLKYSVPLASGVIISGHRSKGQDKNLIRPKTNLLPTIYPAGLYKK